MIDHVTLTVSNLARSKEFYVKALAPLGYVVIMEFGKELTGDTGYVGMGVGGKPDFWLKEGTPTKPIFHVAFRADSQAHVDEFHGAALKAGAKDNGAPGPRKDYHPSYYGAFVLDPDGQNVEACCHLP